MFDILKSALIDALIDNVKILPFLFLTFLLMEYIEEKMEKKTRQALKKAGKTGPVLGGLVGTVPQCGLSAAASNLYAGRVITMGTLLAVYLSTSDEMLPIMISEAVSPKLIAVILMTKIAIGIVAGYIIDFVMFSVMKQKQKDVDIHHFCEHEHCECGQGILKPAIKHTLKIFAFLLIVSIVIGVIIETLGLEYISSSIMASPFVGPVIAGVVGIIPNCAASVVITKLYLEQAISFGTMISGLLVGSGVGILVLFKVNEDKRENISVLGLLFIIGVISGILLNIFVK